MRQVIVIDLTTGTNVGPEGFLGLTEPALCLWRIEGNRNDPKFSDR